MSDEKKINSMKRSLLLSFKKKKKSHLFAFSKEEKAIDSSEEQKTTQKHHVFFFCYCVYSWGEDESAEKAGGRERFFVGFDRE